MENKEKIYGYFVSYYYETKHRQQGWGNTYLELNKKITNYDIIEKAANLIKDNQNCKEVVITNFIKIKEETK